MSWQESVRLAHQAVVAFAGAGMINRAEPRACGCSRQLNGHGCKVIASETRLLTPGQMRVAGRALNDGQTSWDGRTVGIRLHFQPCRGKPAARNEWRGLGKDARQCCVHPSPTRLKRLSLYGQSLAKRPGEC